MIAKSKMLALLSASLFIGTSAAAATLAVGRDRENVRVVAASSDVICPPGACSIVTKTAAGGPPSVVKTVADPDAPTPAPRSWSPVMVATTETRF